MKENIYRGELHKVERSDADSGVGSEIDASDLPMLVKKDTSKGLKTKEDKFHSREKKKHKRHKIASKLP